jgi:drug/metabolite transporter (DMT)-like permease
VAYTLQIVGQKYAEPAVASISMSLESVFAALGGWVISGNGLSGRELLGCGLVFVAIIVAQLPQFRKNTGIKA